MKKLFKNRKGFTLVELMVVVAIMGILVAVAIPVFNNVTEKAKVTTCQANQRTIESAVMMYNISEATPLTGDMTDAVLAAALVPTGPDTTKYLVEMPSCPTAPAKVANGTYGLKADGKVTCTINAEDHDNNAVANP